MSASRLSLKNTIAISVVVVLGIAVTLLNVQTFGKGRGPSRRVQASIQDKSALPEDLAVLVRDAGKAASLGRYPDRSAERQLPNLARDPFVSDHQPVVTVLVDSPAGPEMVTLVCSAVMIGGKRSVAMINGKTFAAGDNLSGLTVTAVSTRGVTLQDDSGETVFLAVGVQDDDSPALMIEFKTKQTHAEVVTKMTERNLP